MHRMRRAALSWTLPALLAALLPAGEAAAELIRPSPGRSYPEIASGLGGSLNYTYDAASGTGTFHAQDTPYLVAGGPTLAVEFPVQATADGVRKQTVDVALDPSGRLLSSPGNLYELYGTVVTGGHTYTGLLLKGVPTAFGAQAADPLGVSSTPTFDMNVKITGGQLAGTFGPDAYLRIMPTCDTTFDGSFAKGFSAAEPSGNIRAMNAPDPFPAPEPTTLALLLVSGAGVMGLRRLRAACPKD